MHNNADQVEALLDEVANEVTKERTAREGSVNTARRGEDTDRPRDRRGDRDRRDRDYRSRDHRDHHRDRRARESNGERRDSRDGDRRRRDGSRPRSSKDADTDEEHSDRYSRRGRGDRDRAGDYYRGGGRPRSRSPRDRDDRYRGRDRSPRERSRDRRRGGGGGGGGGGGRRRSPTPDVPDADDRDKRTVFVQQITQRAATKDLHKFFEVVGPVVEAQIVKDRVTGRSKGVGYVEFKDEESVAKAIELTGHKLKGIPLIVQLTEAEKNRASRETQGGATAGTNGAPFHRLYVGNIHFNITEEDLREIFAPYGELEEVTLQHDEQNPTRSKGYGFVQYVDPANARNALSEMNNFELAGRSIRVGLGNDKFTPESTANLLRNFPAQQQAYQGSAFSGAGGRGAYAGGAGGMFDRTHGKDDRGVSGASALDDSDVSGVNFRHYDRFKLMNSLARGEDSSVTKKDAPAAPIARARRPDDQPAKSRCIKIQDAFNAEEEFKSYGVKWSSELETEVKAECEKQYGKVVHMAVDPQSDGDIYVKFDALTSSEKALQGLNGRRFNFRVIRASYVVDQVYHSLYPAALSK